MEFVGNQINVKSVLATLTVAFFIGRIHLFNGTFPAGIALITVMVAVSTIYIYLVPVMAAAMLTFAGQGMDFYGDMMAMIFCGVFFLFFHRQRFTINQRTAVAVLAMLLFNLLYYGAGHILYLLSLKMLLKEAVAVMIYIRVFNTLARLIFGGGKQNISAEKAGVAVGIAAVSMIGSIDAASVVFPLWLFTAAIVQYCKGLQSALTLTAFAAVFSVCQNGLNGNLFLSLCTGLVAGWFFMSLIDGRYRKTVLAAVLFFTVAISANQQIYGAAVAMALFTAIPQSILTRIWAVAAERFVPEDISETDLQMAKIRQNLLRKKQIFTELGKLYGETMGSRQMISYQFEGMARTVDQLMADFYGRSGGARSTARPISVGSASYAFEGVSGDSCLSFSFGKDKQALVISDGMGKGSRAEAESRLVVTTLSRLLEAGFDIDLAMKTINSILMTGSTAEMFATLDLAIIDKENHKVQIFKMGAASTFVKHDGKVSMLKRPALPVGIVDGVKLEYIDVRLKRGDLLIMVSDGVTDCDRKDPECRWLRQRLCEIGTRDPETVAELIVNKAAEKYGIRERDDLTVMVAAI